MVKKFLFVIPILLIFWLAGCQTAETHADNSAGDILALFDRYWDLGEDAETGREFMRRFREEPALVLEALSIASPFQREQMLVLMGSTIAGAMRTDPAAYAQYAAALELAAGLDLDEESARMLRFVYANIAHFSGR